MFYKKIKYGEYINLMLILNNVFNIKLILINCVVEFICLLSLIFLIWEK